jgi:hypothetical protein
LIESMTQTLQLCGEFNSWVQCVLLFQLAPDKLSQQRTNLSGFLSNDAIHDHDG